MDRATSDGHGRAGGAAIWVGRSQCYARLTGLARVRLIRHERVLYGQPGVYTATVDGLQFADVPLPPASIDLRTYDHDLEMVALVSEIEREGHGRVLTEREVRAIDTPAGRSAESYRPRYAVLLGHGRQLQLTPGGSPRVHFPDAVIVDTNDRAVAIELERTAKGRARLRGILRGYVGARHLAEVRYYTADDRVRSMVCDEVAALRAEPVIRVMPSPVARTANAA